MLHPLKRRRLEGGLSQWELGRLSMIPQSYISEIETGKRLARKWERKALAFVLNCEEDELFERIFADS